MDDVTIAALAISLASIVLVTLSYASFRNHITRQYHKDETRPDDPESSLEVAAIVSEFSQRLKRLEENLVDQKVKLEILELRVSRATGVVPSPARQERYEQQSSPVERPAGSVQLSQDNSRVIEPRAERMIAPIRSPNQTDVTDKRALGSTEMEALRKVFEGRGKATAKDIQQKVGRTREHTARMMNSLFQEGLVERDITVRPFAYSITQKGRDLLNT